MQMMNSMNDSNKRPPRKIVGNPHHVHSHSNHEIISSNMGLLQPPQQISMCTLVPPPTHAHLLGPPPRMSQPLLHTPSNVSHSPGLLTAPPSQHIERMRITNIMNNEVPHSGWAYGPQFVMPPPFYTTYGAPMAYYVTNNQRMPHCHPMPSMQPPHVCHTYPPSNGTSNIQSYNANENGSSSSCQTSSPSGFVAGWQPLAHMPNGANLMREGLHPSLLNQSRDVLARPMLKINQELPIQPSVARNYPTLCKGDVSPIIAMEEGFAPSQEDREEDREEKRKENQNEQSERFNNDSDINSSVEGGIAFTDQEFANDRGAGGDASMMSAPPGDSDEVINISLPKYKELTRLALRGSEIAEKLAYTHRNRPCFKKIDSLCARLKQDLIRPDGVLPNINSQGIAWAVKDFIFVFTRIISAWLIIKGYVFNTPEGLKKVIDSLDDDFLSRFNIWQDATHDFAESILKSFINLDKLVQSQKNVYQKQDGTNASAPSAATLLDETFDFLNSTAELVAPVKNYLFTMVEDSEGSQRQATANGTYFKTGTYNPIKKDSTNGQEQTSLPSSPTPTSSNLPESAPTNDMRNITLDLQGCPHSMKMQYIPQTSTATKTLSPASMSSEIVTPKTNDLNGNSTVNKTISSIGFGDFTMRNQSNADNGNNTESSEDESPENDGNGITNIDNDFRNNSDQNGWFRENNSSEIFHPTFTVPNIESLENRANSLPILDENLSDSMPAAFSKMEAATIAAAASTFLRAPLVDPPPNWINYDVRVLNGCDELVNSQVVFNKPLLDKLNVLIQRLVSMDNSTLFFRTEFTRNYYPDLVELARKEDIMDLRSVIIKVESGAYTDIGDVVRDIRMLIYATKGYLKQYPNIKLHAAAIAYEAEIDYILSQPPFELSDFEHITGAPDDTVNLGTRSNESKKTECVQTLSFH